MVISKELKDGTYIGIVIDNNDPKKIGRIRARVVNIFDEIPDEDIPWSSPWKDLNGNSFNLPDVGKIVTIIFDQGNPYKPEYIYAEHYNVNLTQKLESISDGAYKSMKSIMFDHKTQIFSNDDDGLVVDYKFNNINILEDSININVKDNYTSLNLGDSNANQPVILGNNWMEWFDEFVENLLGSNGGPYLGNLSSPVLPNPAMISVLQKYKTLRDPKFLSKNVYVVNNDKVETVLKNKSNRPNDSKFGDKFTSTTKNLPSYDNSFPDPSGSNGPEVDDNINANSQFDSNKTNITTNPVYSGEEFNNVIISDFAKEVVAIMRTQVGVMENPMNSNSGNEVREYQKATHLSGTGWAWCAAFVCWCFQKVADSKKVPYSFKLPKTAGAYDFANWAKRNSEYIEVVKDKNKILPGDLIIFNFSHIGISNGVVKNGRLDTIEGNTDGKGSREGGGVYKKSRALSIIKTVLRIKYNPERVKTKSKNIE